MILEGHDRNQTKLFTSLEEIISSDNPVRLIETIVVGVVKANRLDYESKGSRSTGRPAYPFETMLKLYVYGYLNRIKSSRQLEIEAGRNVELMWLLGDLRPDFKTISNFRKENKESIARFVKSLRQFLKKSGLAPGATVAIDGTKLKANAGRKMLYREDILGRIAEINVEIEEYEKQIEAEDAAEQAVEALQGRYEQEIAEMRDEISTLKNALETLSAQKKNHISLTDRDCRNMKSREGKLPCYNVQLAADVEHGFIVADAVADHTNDLNSLEPMVDEVESQLQDKPRTAIADAGYCNLEQIQAVEEKGVLCYVPTPKQQGLRDGIKITYDKERDRYVCSEGGDLVPTHRNKKHKNSWVSIYVGENCNGCRLRDRCTKSKRGRNVSRYWNQEYRDSFRERMTSAEAKEMSIKRKATIERVFGVLKQWLGKIPILTRGRENVANEIKLAAASYNVRRLITILTNEEAAELIGKYA